jgi:glutamate synthase (ferredoxin)
MTGGRVVVLGKTGRNFAAGMSGGMAFVLNADGGFGRRCNLELVDLEPLERPEDVELVGELLARHARYTGSELAARLLCDWSVTAGLFVKVMPRDYRRALEAQWGASSNAAQSEQIAVPVELANG